MFRYWGKARPDSMDGAQFHLLPYHSLDVAAVGYEFLRRSPALCRFLMRCLGVAEEFAVFRWAAFWLALHDIGKFSEAFQGQKPELFQVLRRRMPAKGYGLRHDSLGMLFWSERLSEQVIAEGWFGSRTSSIADGLDYWMRAVTGHHGQPPKVTVGDHWRQHFDVREDDRAIIAFARAVRTLFLDSAVAAIPLGAGATSFNRASQELSWWIAGLAVLADWLGSNTAFFEYRADVEKPADIADYWQYALGQASVALDASGVLPVGVDPVAGFADLFPEIASPSPLQNWSQTVDVAGAPELYLLEDVTGAGKTEAAVALAHRVMKAGSADGFFIALPTMATANAMYGRVARVYHELFSACASLALAHGQRDLVEAFAASVLPVSPTDDDYEQADETATARCTVWLADHNKRALLAPAGVGTVDQVLLAVLHSKHQSLRLLGLFRKVLIVDEVHACDAYMQAVLEALLEFHARAGGSAILLSATLPYRMKRSLLEAFARGCRLAAPSITGRGYPLATRWDSASPDSIVETRLLTRKDVCRTVSVCYAYDETDVVAGIESALRSGKCVCWMRNTIADAVSAYERFRDRVPQEKLTLFHARFALKDRLDIEGQVLSYFGRDSGPGVRAGRLLIATQVVEQSLDVDFDFVVTDLAPIDRIIQRAGRLQRHVRDETGQRLDDRVRRDGRAAPCLWVFGPRWSEVPEKDWFTAALPKASRVYPHHGQLWLTAQLLQKGCFVMPDDARQLIEHVFGGDAPMPEQLQRNALDAEGREYADASVAQQHALKLGMGYVRGGIDWWSEAQTPTRLGEASTSVLLARWEGDRLRNWTDGHHGLAYSSVRVPERLIARRLEGSDPVREAAIVRYLDTLPNRARWSVLLPLVETPDGWVGTAWSAPGGKSGETLLHWTYSAATGLRQFEREEDE